MGRRTIGPEPTISIQFYNVYDITSGIEKSPVELQIVELEQTLVGKSELTTG